VGADPADARRDADDAPQLHHDRYALHRVAAVRRGRDAPRFPLRGAQRHPPLPVRGACERPRGTPSLRPDRPRGGRRGDRRRADLLDQPGAHARLLRRAGRGAHGLRRHRPLLPQGPGRPPDDRRRPRARPSLRRDRAHGGAPQPLHHRACAARVHGGSAGRLRRAAHGARAGRQRDLAADRRVDAPQPRGRGVRARARHGAARGRVRVLRGAREGQRACRPARRASTTPRTTTISCRAGW
jgi:hypothetical protein